MTHLPPPLTQTVAKYRDAAHLPPPLFSSTVNRAHVDLPWPDFSFYMPRKSHKLRTPPWRSLHPQMLNQSSTIRCDANLTYLTLYHFALR